MKEVRVYTADEISNLYFQISGQMISIVKANDLKVYTGNTAYIDKKKLNLSGQDLQTIENAKQIYFLYNCEGKAFVNYYGNFSISRFGHGGYSPSNIEEFEKILSENNISIIKTK